MIAEISDRHRLATMAALRVTFLSSLILELLSTVSVALVAVAVGLRLLNGHLDLRTALFVLVLVARGLPAAARARRQLSRQRRGHQRGRAGVRGARDAAGAARSRRRCSRPGEQRDRLRRGDASTTPSVPKARSTRSRCGSSRARSSPSPGRAAAASRRCSACCSGSSGSTSGSVRIGDRELADLDPDAWRSRLAWMPQRPHLFAGIDRRQHRASAARSATDEEILAAADCGRPRRAAGPPARRAAGAGRRAWRGAVGGRAPAARAGAPVPPGCPAGAARRADRQPRRRDRERSARGGAAACARDGP